MLSQQEFISIIIPVLNGSGQLSRCLQELENQTYPRSHYEVIVVDNGSSENIEAATAPFSQVRLLHEPRAGSYNARNAGLAEARGSIIAFTDADCLPARNWLEEGVKALMSRPNCGLVAGDVQFYFCDPHAPTVIELCDSVMHLQQKYYLRDSHFGVTANIFTLKHVIEAVGNFDSALSSGGDREWGERVFKAGYGQVYAAQALVQHPARVSFQEFYGKVIRTAKGTATLRAREHNIVTFLQALAYDLKPPVKAVLRLPTRNPILKLKAALALLGFKYLIAFEKARLYFQAVEEAL